MIDPATTIAALDTNNPADQGDPPREGAAVIRAFKNVVKADAMDLSTNQTVAGNKTFSGTTAHQAMTGTTLTLSSTLSVGGTSTFNGTPTLTGTTGTSWVVTNTASTPLTGFYGANQNEVLAGSADAVPFALATNGTVRLRIGGTGGPVHITSTNIDATNPGLRVGSSATAGAAGTIIMARAGNVILRGVNSSNSIETQFGDNGSTGIVGTFSNSGFIVRTNNLDRLGISGSGEVRVASTTANTTSPAFRVGAATSDFVGAQMSLVIPGTAQFAISDSVSSTALYLGAFSGGGWIGTATNHPLQFYVNGSNRFAIATTGAITTPNLQAGEVGYKGAPLNSQAGNYTLQLADAGRTIQYIGAGGHTYTIPANASVAFPIGTVIVITHFGTASTSISIAITTDTLYLDGTNYASTGTRTMQSGSTATLIKCSSTGWIISGIGIT